MTDSEPVCDLLAAAAVEMASRTGTPSEIEDNGRSEVGGYHTVVCCAHKKGMLFVSRKQAWLAEVTTEMDKEVRMRQDRRSADSRR